MNPRQGVAALRYARRLWDDDTRVGTFLAVLLVAILVGLPAYRFWRADR